MVVQHNLTALNSNRMLGLNNASLSKMTEKLSSGYRVNRAADDAAGLAISEKMRRQIRGLTQASANCQDGVSLCQIADGALNEVQDMLKRCEELAVQAANDTNTTEDRAYIQMELDALEKEIDRVHETTVFNNQNIFSDLGITPTFIAPGTSDSGNVMVNTDGSLSLSTPEGIYIEVGMVDSNGNRIPSVDAAQATGTANNSSISSSGLAQFAKKAAANAVAKLASHYPTLFSSAATQGIQVGLELSNIDGKNKTLASASASLIPSGSDAVMSYRLKIDTSDYPISAFDSYTDSQKADLAAVIAHEMTHVMMFDTVSNKMLGKDTFPLWFIEGMAQTSSGDNGWVSNSLNPSSSDNAIRSYMSNLVGSPYGAGYLATLYLGMSASGESMDHFDQNYNVAADISKGLDKVLTDVAKGKSFDDAIKDNTNGKFTSQSDFQSKFMSGEADALNFVKKVLNARGTAGAGSILYELNGSEVNCFGPDYLNSDYTTYMVNPDNTWYSNATGSDINWPQMGGGSTGGGGNGNGFLIQAGAEKDQYIHINQYNISANSLFGGLKMDVTGEYTGPDGTSSADYTGTVTLGDAATRGMTIDIIKEADRKVSIIRSYYGATQNRLEHTIRNLDNIVENTTAAESQIRDTDMSKAMVAYSNSNILAQAGRTMLAQANQSTQGILSLLQ